MPSSEVHIKRSSLRRAALSHSVIAAECLFDSLRLEISSLGLSDTVWNTCLPFPLSIRPWHMIYPSYVVEVLFLVYFLLSHAR